MPVRQPPPPPAAPEEDPARIVNEFWDSFEELFSRYNEQQGAAGELPLTARELADKVDVSDRTFSDWRNKRIVPSDPVPLVGAAVFLGGRKEDWQARWRKARAAHERLVADRRGQPKPSSEDGRTAAPPGPPPDDDSAEGKPAGHRGPAGSVSNGAEPPPRRRFRQRRGTPTALAAAGIAVLVSFLTPLPSWLSAHVFQQGSPTGPALTVTAEPVTLDDQGNTMATAEGRHPSTQVLHLMSQPGAATSPQFLRDLRADGGVNVEASTVQLIVNGRSSQGVRIIYIRPVALHRMAPLGGTLYLMPSQAGNATIKMMFDLDELNPLPRQDGSSSDPGAGDPQQQLAGFIIGVHPGDPFFDAETIHLADNEQQVINIRMQVTRFYATFDLEIDYIIGTDSGDVHKLTVTDNGHPFSITGTPPGQTPGTAAYQQAFQLQGNFSLCQVSDPGQIPLSATAPPLPCR